MAVNIVDHNSSLNTLIAQYYAMEYFSTPLYELNKEPKKIF